MSIFSSLLSKIIPHKSKRVRRSRRRLGSVEALESRVVMNADPVLMVIASENSFYYQEYGDTRDSIEAAGLEVEVAATTVNPSIPHPGTGQSVTPDGHGIVTPNVALTDVDVDDYSGIVFVGGWGSSMYQYAFPGDYTNNHYDGDSATKEIVNSLIGDFMSEDKTVAAICHGVTVLAWARVDGVSPLNDRQVSVPDVGSPAVLYQDVYYGNSELGQRIQVLENGAIPNGVSGQYGDPTHKFDDVVVDGNIITAEDFDAAAYFGEVVASEILDAANGEEGSEEETGGGEESGEEGGGEEETGSEDELFLISDQFLTANQMAESGLHVALPEVDQEVNPAWQLDQDYGFYAPDWLANGGYGENHHGAGEVWVQDNNGEAGFTWHFITPAGTLHAWAGSIDSSPLIADLGSEFHSAPSLLTDPQPTTGTGIEYSVSVISDSPAIVLDQAHEFFAPESLVNANYGENYHGAGEVWVQDNNGEAGFTWHFITPEGDLHQWNGSFESSSLIASLGSEFHANPALLTNAADGVASVYVENQVLTIDTAPGFVGEFEVQVITNHPGMVAEQSFVVTVTNEAPFVGPIQNQVMIGEQTMLEIPLDVSDADGDALEISVEIVDQAYRLNQSLGLHGSGDFGFNWGGQNEKWMQGAGGWYFILENGNLYHWQGSFENSQVIATLDTSYYDDPNRLVDAQAIPVTAEVIDGVLVIHRDSSHGGIFEVTVTVSDGIESQSVSFDVSYQEA